MTQSPLVTLREAPQILLAIDPGRMNGIAIFHGKIVHWIGQVHIDDLPDFLFSQAEEYRGDEVQVVYENFKLMRGKALQQSGSTMEASQAIGQVKMIAAKNKWPVADQAPAIKPIAEKWSGMKAPSDHKISHQVDAYNHGVYWLVKNGMRMIEDGT